MSTWIFPLNTSLAEERLNIERNTNYLTMTFQGWLVLSGYELPPYCGQTHHTDVEPPITPTTDLSSSPSSKVLPKWC